MTEVEWLMATDPGAMLAWLHGHGSRRKIRLYLCAGCRTIWHLLTSEESQHAVEVSERYADGLVRNEELWNANHHSEADGLQLPYDRRHRAAWLANLTTRPSDLLIDLEPHRQLPYGFSVWFTMMRRHMKEFSWPEARILHDIFGNPFHPTTLNPSWLTTTVLALANGIYQEKAFERMPILADALQDAGCDHGDILNHCRQSGEHVRGCWVIDFLTGRE
jgi:hypothetical protein